MKNNRKFGFALKIDISKAYDMVPQTKIWSSKKNTLYYPTNLFLLGSSLSLLTRFLQGSSLVKEAREKGILFHPFCSFWWLKS